MGCMQQTRSGSEMEILLLRQDGSQETETGKEMEPKVTVSKAQGQCPRQELEEQLTRCKNVQSQHSETALMTDFPHPGWGNTFGKHPPHLGFGSAINVGVISLTL